MRILHTADWHLGKVLHEVSVLEDQRFILDQVASELSAGDYDALVIAGDLFDRAVPPPEAVSLFDDFLVSLRRQCPSLTMVVIPGNHDSAARLAYAARFLQSQGIHVLTDPSQLDKPITIVREGQEVDIFGVPWLQGSSQIQAWQQALSRLQAAKRPGIPALLCAHLFTLGGHESDSERILVGEGEQIPVAWLEGWDYVALGHLHRTQQPAQRVWYSGSPMAYSFSEAATQTTAAPKHLLRVDLGPVPAVTPIGLSPLRPMSRLAGGFEDFLSNPKWAPFEGHLLELTLSDASLVSQPMDRLRARFPHLLTLLQTSQTASVSSQLPLPSAQAGSLRSDALAFLADLAPGTLEAGQPWVDRLSVEVQRETP